MSDIAIKVENLSKRYVLNHQRAAGDGLRHVLQEKLTAPLRWLGGKIRSQKSEVSPPTSDLRPPTSDPRPPTSDPRPPTSEEFFALRDVSFDVKRGEVVGIIGRNGAGKSTLLKILSRITEPTSGRITIEGRVASLLEVGTGFHPDLTGRENIFLNGAILGMSRVEIKSKFDEIVAFAEIEKFLDTPVKRYSSGMYVRLAFAVAAHLEPEILIVDEVIAVGDAKFQEKCLGQIKTLSTQANRTVLFVSHNMPMIQALTSRCLVLDQGKVAFDGLTGAAIQQYFAQFNSAQTILQGTHKKASESPHFLEVWFETMSKNRIETLLSSQEVVLCISWNNPSNVPGLRVGFGINDSIGGRIFGSVPEDAGGVTPQLSGRHKARILIPSNLLLGKRYSIDLCLWIPNGAVFEFLQPAKVFSVYPGTSPILTVDPNREGQIQFLANWKFNGI